MSKFFLSCDIEGTCGIAAWEETEAKEPAYAAFADQMSREVSAACEGLLAAGANAIRVRDAHETARNIRPQLLPQREEITLMRGWGREPLGMMNGLDESYDGVLFTGYHSACGWNGNPLSHTTNLRNISVRINGETAPELLINSLTAAMFDVPVLMVAGDQMLCSWFHSKVPAALTVPVSRGEGNGSCSIMPGVACHKIQEAARQAASLDRKACLFPMPSSFDVEVTYREHQAARGNSWFPGARQTDSRTISFCSDKWMDVLVFFHFCM